MCNPLNQISPPVGKGYLYTLSLWLMHVPKQRMGHNNNKRGAFSMCVHTLVGIWGPKLLFKSCFCGMVISLFNFIPFHKWMKSKIKNLETFSGNSFFWIKPFSHVLGVKLEKQAKRNNKRGTAATAFYFYFLINEHYRSLLTVTGYVCELMIILTWMIFMASEPSTVCDNGWADCFFKISNVHSIEFVVIPW